MKILDLTISDFRGFGRNEKPLKLDSDLVLFYGSNGYGKSSIAEAIEWLFYGATKRRQLGDSYSKVEYAGTYANVHRKHPTEVSARVRMSDGHEYTLTRRLPLNAKDEVSQLFIDGTPKDFATIGLNPAETVYPVVTQHSLQTFIHTRPKERRDAISAALGLEEVTQLKSALDGARRSFNLTPPTEVTAARAHLKGFAVILSTIPETTAVAARWNQTPVRVDHKQDVAALERAAQKLSGKSPPTRAGLLDALREARRDASKSVFDTNKISPAPIAEAALSRLSNGAQPTREILDKVADETAQTVAITTAAYSTELLAFWETGLRLAPEGERCPMCEALTLTMRQRKIIQGRVAAQQRVVEANTRLKAAIGRAVTALEAIEQTIPSTTVGSPSQAEWETLSRLMAGIESTLEGFRAVHLTQATSGRELEDEIRAALSRMRTLTQDLANPAKGTQAAQDVIRIPASVLVALEKHIATAKAYRIAWDEFFRVVAERIATNSLIGQIDTVGKALKAASSISILAAFDSILDSSKILMQRTETYLQKKQTEMLKQRGKEVQDLYDRLNPGASVGFEGMEPASDQIRLNARSFGVRMSAAANLSQCQLNCLGLAVWIMRATTPESPFGFIVLDDPIQSMDDDHCEAFMDSVLPYLMDDHGKQIILLSHVKDIIDRTAALNVTRAIKVYHFEKYEKSGPVITEQVKLAKLLSEIRAYADGNESHRAIAVDRLRVLIEQFVRELHLKIVGTPAAPEYDNVAASDLLKLFRQIPGTSPDECARLKDTVGFTDPAHHSEVGYTVPQKTNIQPHIQRLETLMRKYGLIS
jgi:hypothetical protein